MNNTEENYTDNFFRQGLSSPPEFSPSDKNWKEMKRLLAIKSKRRTIAWIYTVTGVAAAILIFFSLWLVPEKTDNSTQQAKKFDSTKEKPETGKSANLSPVKAEPGDRVLTPEGGMPDDGINVLTVSSKRIVLLDNNAKTINVSNESTVPGGPPTAGDFAGMDVINSARFSNIQPSLGEKFASQRNIEMVTPSASIAKELVAEDELPDDRTSASAGKWALSLSFSPDFNSVNDMRKGNLGGSMGMGISYKLGKALSIGTGVYYSQKLYSADKTSYKVTEKPFATWTSYSRKIDADCRVIDVPVNLSLRISNKTSNKLYASAGMSSYIMLSEKYAFIYNNPSPAFPTGRREYTIRNENEHILNVVNLAVALEKPLSNQVSLVIQPYAKLPLTGIGKGQTDLKSVGIGFGLNYGMKKK